MGALNWGTLSPASDNPAVLADISGTVIELNAVGFEGPGFFLRPKGGPGGINGITNQGIQAGSALSWGDFQTCVGLGAGIGADCFGGPQAAVRYDSPTWGGFRFETSYGENQGLDGIQTGFFNSSVPAFIGEAAENQDFWDIAVFYGRLELDQIVGGCSLHLDGRCERHIWGHRIQFYYWAFRRHCQWRENRTCFRWARASCISRPVWVSMASIRKRIQTV